MTHIHLNFGFGEGGFNLYDNSEALHLKNLLKEAKSAYEMETMMNVYFFMDLLSVKCSSVDCFTDEDPFPFLLEFKVLKEKLETTVYAFASENIIVSLREKMNDRYKPGIYTQNGN